MSILLVAATKRIWTPLHIIDSSKNDSITVHTLAFSFFSINRCTGPHINFTLWYLIRSSNFLFDIQFISTVIPTRQDNLKNWNFIFLRLFLLDHSSFINCTRSSTLATNLMSLKEILYTIRIDKSKDIYDVSCHYLSRLK